MPACITASKGRLYKTARLARLDHEWKPVMSQGVNSSLLSTLLTVIASEKSATITKDLAMLITHTSHGARAIFEVADVEFILNELTEARAELAQLKNKQQMVAEPLGLNVFAEDFDVEDN